MRSLLIFDRSISSDELSSVVPERSGVSVDIFPLTSDYTVIAEVESALAQRGAAVGRILDAALRVDKNVRIIRDKICAWSADIGACDTGGKSLKERLMVSGENISAWWFGILSEKNPQKSGVFLKLAQAHAVGELLAGNSYDACIIAVSYSDLCSVIENMAAVKGVGYKRLYSGDKNGLAFKERLSMMGAFGNLIVSFAKVMYFVSRAWRARRAMGFSADSTSGSFLFVTYFPSVDRDKADEGIFRNKFASALQDKLNEMKIPVKWLLMCVPYEGFDFPAALRFAAKFKENGERLVVLEEFLRVSDAVKTLYVLIRQAFISVVFYDNALNSLLKEPFGRACEPLVRPLWFRSLCGGSAAEGLLYYFMYKRVFKSMPDMSDCLYYAEMHAWERGLNAAKKEVNNKIRTIGFQHSYVSSNHFFYSCDPGETVRSGQVTDLPLPDVFACNGGQSHSILSASGYGGLTVVEAVRHLYIEELLKAPLSRDMNGRSVLLVAGSIDRKESKALISLVHAAFRSAGECAIHFKGHPSMPFEPLWEELGIDVKQTGYVIRHEPVSECLSEARAVIVPSSTVAVEALAFGCEVILPLMPDAINMNPLADIEGYFHRATSPEELADTVRRIMSGHVLHTPDEYRELIRNYWLIDGSLNEWSKILSSVDIGHSA